MTKARRRSTVLAAVLAALFALACGTANATSTYRGAWAGVFSTKASCDSSSANRNDPPEVLTYPCEYHTSDPRSPSGGGLAGWYYFYRYSVSMRLSPAAPQFPDKPLLANGFAAAAQDQTQVGPSIRGRGAATVTNFTSRNWAGYFTTNAAHTTDFRSVHARWVQPKVTCPAAKDAWVVSWVGMDGWWNDVVEQGGSSARCVNGVAQYALWWEMFPHNNIQTANPIKPGDLIDATITYDAAAARFRIVVKDLTTGQTLQQVQPCYPDMGGCPRVNAEVITETPLGGNAGDGVFFLPDYRAVRYDHVSVTDTSGHVGALNNAHWDLGHVDQVSPSSGVRKQTTSALGSGGASFSTVWVHE